MLDLINCKYIIKINKHLSHLQLTLHNIHTQIRDIKINFNCPLTSKKNHTAMLAAHRSLPWQHIGLSLALLLSHQSYAELRHTPQPPQTSHMTPSYFARGSNLTECKTMIFGAVAVAV